MRTHRPSRLRHTMWIGPLVVAAAAWAGVVSIAHYETTHPILHGAGGGLIAIAAIPALALTLTGVSLALRNGWQMRWAIRQEKREELVRRRRAVEYAAGWRDAQALAAQLLAGQRREPLTVWGLVLRPGETAHFDVTAKYSRLISTSYGYDSWSEPQPVRAIATDRRLLCDTGRWLSFWYHDITGFYPDIQGGSVVMDFDETAPLALSGADAPVITVCTAERLYGHDFSCQPELANLMA